MQAIRFAVWLTFGFLLLHGSAFAFQTVSPTEPKPDRETKNSQVSELKTVELAFRDQEWLPALKWLAAELDLNLDWQTLPEDTFNLHSSQPYTLQEAEDLINLQLLGRGFTLLGRGEVLRVVPLKDIDVTLVPHIEADLLEQTPAHRFVRVSFPLEWMIADEAAKEFLPLMSPYGKLFPMASSNRLEAMDAVVNLREVHRLLTRAENDEGRRERIAEFHLQYRKAIEVAPKVRQLVGLPPEPISAGSSVQTQLDIEQARFKVEAVKQMGSSAKELLTEKQPTIFITINDKENSILVNAPPNKIEIVRQAIDAMDKPVPPTASTWETIGKVKVHEVEGFDPETISRLLSSLQERGNLAKETRIQHEAAYNRLIVFASAEDHLTISQVVDSFRAQKRSASVLQLMSLDPVYAAKSVQLVLKSPDRPSSTPGVASDGKFQIEADPDHRRLLLWATPTEVTEVREFLIRLGESFSQSVSTSQMHVIQINVPIQAVSQKMQRLWSDISDSPLVIEGQESDLIEPSPVEMKDEKPIRTSDSSLPEHAVNCIKGDVIKLVSKVESFSNVSSNGQTKASGTGHAPVRIIPGENGEVIILSKDPNAAESAKRLLQQLAPSISAIRIVDLKNAQAMSVKLQLETMLLHTLPPSTTKLASLSTSAPFKIDIDGRTNRLLIQNANARQIELIDQLVPIIDQSTGDDDRLIRVQKVYRFQHRRASDVIDAVKEVYRDLLSVNDRVYTSGTNSRPAGYNENLAASASNPEYQGLLSVGVDREANAMIISAPSYLVESVVELMESIDMPVDSGSMAVVPFNIKPADTKTQEAISKLLSRPKK
jgi:type II secretory pathway component GspD/PulD (secretin)